MLTGYKFESIRRLNNQGIIAWEMLSTLRPNIDAEVYFSSLPQEKRISLFANQVNYALYTPCAQCYYINADSEVFLSSTMAEVIAGHNFCQPKFALELTDLCNIMQLSSVQIRKLRQRITQLQAMNIQVWADDITPGLIHFLLKEKFYFYGVKIDKYVFWELRGHQNHLNDLVRTCQKLCAKVLIEGIENYHDFLSAQLSVADYGQGYMWKPVAHSFNLRTPGE
ncbi:hypothetical protein DT73_14145 [Mangrovibacter sp. MFB070]|uniref:EAL domain-containing protein n=1 Tax=Mangrovibacter sp. MFB070 TaxID=1224318 RepID=UPI0004DB0C9E|nr:EAL domain-containing protein [Mangrovibacter sp. MFB070]KEA52044.1 hypothetical protein DT73_14145 [Mangrovibacter sp. MFB070]